MTVLRYIKWLPARPAWAVVLCAAVAALTAGAAAEFSPRLYRAQCRLAFSWLPAQRACGAVALAQVAMSDEVLACMLDETWSPAKGTAAARATAAELTQARELAGAEVLKDRDDSCVLLLSAACRAGSEGDGGLARRRALRLAHATGARARELFGTGGAGEGMADAQRRLARVEASCAELSRRLEALAAPPTTAPADQALQAHVDYLSAALAAQTAPPEARPQDEPPAAVLLAGPTDVRPPSPVAKAAWTGAGAGAVAGAMLVLTGALLRRSAKKGHPHQ